MTTVKQNRVGLLTFHYSINYGAVLQAYGLQKAIANLGYDVEVIDYRPKAARQYVNQLGIRSRRFLTALKQRREFKRFIKTRFHLSGRTYYKPQDFESYPPEYYQFVTGSDQPWNIIAPRGFDRPFFLDFAQRQNARCISYAPSFGKTTLKDLGAASEEIRQLLLGFHALSVREQAGCGLVKQLTGRDAAYVMDPCFLVDYDEITQEPDLDNDYLLIYANGLKPWAVESICKLAREKKLDIVSVNFPVSWADQNNPSSSPERWLGLFKNASMVCTNYFHGTAFSIKHKKDFAVFPRSGNESRMIDLLKRVSLNSRFISEEEVHGFRKLAEHTDYGTASDRIEESIRSSIFYIQSALGKSS